MGHPLPLSAGHHPEVVEGGHEVVLSNAQVLRGKLQRAGHKLARDVYDACTATDVDPESLEQAVNTFPHEQVEIRALDWLVGNDRIGRNAHERLRGVPTEVEAATTSWENEAPRSWSNRPTIGFASGPTEEPSSSRQ